MKTLIGIPCMDSVPVGFAQSMSCLKTPPNTAVYYKPNSLVYDSRNLISLYAIEHGFDRVLWLDSDMMFPPDVLSQLSQDMDELGSLMVSGLYVKRHEPITPVIYEHVDVPSRDAMTGVLTANIKPYMNYPKNDLFPIEGCGFGCVMTDVKLLKQVWDKFGPAFTPFPWASEDISFCYRVKQLGARVWCDSRISCGHIGQFVYTEDLLIRGDET